MDILFQILTIGFLIASVLVALIFIAIILFRRFKCEICGGYYPGWKVITWIASLESSWDDKYVCKECANKNRKEAL